jgi:hypothetical protein
MSLTIRIQCNINIIMLDLKTNSKTGVIPLCIREWRLFSYNSHSLNETY